MSRNLRLLGAAQFVSLLGDGLYLAAIVNYALQVTAGSARASGMVVVAEHLPYLLLGLWAGVLVDRWDRLKVMKAADLLRAAVLVGLYGADRAGWLSPPGPWTALPVGLAAALVTTGSVFFNPARDALLPALAEGAALTRANAGIAVSQHAAQLLGPLAAAAVLASRPLAESFLWDAGTFLLSFLLLLLIRLPPGAARSAAARMDVAGALAYVRSRPDLKALLGLTALNNLFIMGPAMVGSAFMIRGVAAAGGPFVLPWGAVLGPEAMFALYLAVFSAGMIAGSLAVGRWGGRFPGWALLAAGIALDGLTFLPFEPLAARGDYPGLLVALFFHAVCVPLIVVVRPALVQAHVPAARLGQVFGLVNLAVFGCTALSAAGAGWVLGLGVTPGRLFTLAGVGGGLSGAFALTLPALRRLR